MLGSIVSRLSQLGVVHNLLCLFFCGVKNDLTKIWKEVLAKFAIPVFSFRSYTSNLQQNKKKLVESIDNSKQNHSFSCSWWTEIHCLEEQHLCNVFHPQLSSGVECITVFFPIRSRRYWYVHWMQHNLFGIKSGLHNTDNRYSSWLKTHCNWSKQITSRQVSRKKLGSKSKDLRCAHDCLALSRTLLSAKQQS